MKLLAPFLKTAISGAQTRQSLQKTLNFQTLLMFSIHCALEDLAKLETGGYYADCALAEKAPQVINIDPDEGDGGDDDDGHRGGGKDIGVDADSALAVEASRMLLDNDAICRTG